MPIGLSIIALVIVGRPFERRFAGKVEDEKRALLRCIFGECDVIGIQRRLFFFRQTVQFRAAHFGRGGFELPASGINIAATRRAHRRADPVFKND